MKMKSVLFVLALFCSFSVFAQQEANVMATVAQDAQFSTLSKAVTAAGLDETLKGAGPFTVFAPTDEAFANLGAEKLESLLQPEKKMKLKNILAYHIVDRHYSATALADAIKEGGGSASLVTVQGMTLTASERDGKIILTDERGKESIVTATDIQTANGTIHVVDTVLLPSAAKKKMSPEGTH